jgi:hypothetical protein
MRFTTSPKGKAELGKSPRVGRVTRCVKRETLAGLVRNIICLGALDYANAAGAMKEELRKICEEERWRARDDTNPEAVYV